MVITKMEVQKNHKNRYSVFLDGVFAFGISDFDAFRLHLKEGDMLTEEALESLRHDVLLQDAKRYALHLLDRKEYTETGMKVKLKEHGCDDVCIELTIQFLKDYHYVNDCDFARRYITSALRSEKTGLRKIRYDLIKKGISDNVLEEILTEFNDEEVYQKELDAATSLMLKKTKGDFSFPSLMKGKRYCLSRGFSAETVDAVVRKLKNDSEYVWSDDNYL